MESKVRSIEELYHLVKPALKTKKRELTQLNLPYISEEDIWNYLRISKWKVSEGLSLAEMVSDILNADKDRIDMFVKSKIQGANRKLYFENENN